MNKNRILFLCVENSARSKMAEAYGNHIGLTCKSAGTLPGTSINPLAIEVMEELGIHINLTLPKKMDAEMLQWADMVIIMGCSAEDSCPAPLVAGLKKKMVDWELEDPKGKSLEEVRSIRDQIIKKVGELSSELS
ncbi:arsenate reductase ArsC [Cuniculiplasma divulgatum]|jgi:protein-tyrosine-phosphatase|uniref:Protein-tyrosine-phosphatase n=1 Tax=Cuniculiplasma divulgatum TaxID=1673428 RepID=A0A1N5WLK3_9ARCH|nr:arsenate reductase ArsC [Cuniculiplasma divulgatum]EQB68857.1 MAG: Low molecular weight phosphotyrosine protein phosphatase [Thermoplasmatales archaeon Gpl]MCI2412744.1 arsenate reductase ArsC [Cuniculiplasma sp.]OWP55732.1 MAG: hypothetical protein B2I18_00910 [Cuniculiplasma sp. C_DKE]WMT50009.1 MAG: arsenate reductase ArsC [Thermoplasmatales archaeon]SIM86006.1 protein-tyrosine-phosphatase [Cuniculiplasma divulgatum]